MKTLNIILPLLFLLLAGSCKAQSKTARHQEAAASAAPGKEDVLRVYEKQIRKRCEKGLASKRKDRKLLVHQELLQYVVNHAAN